MSYKGFCLFFMLNNGLEYWVEIFLSFCSKDDDLPCTDFFFSWWYMEHTKVKEMNMGSQTLHHFLIFFLFSNSSKSHSCPLDVSG